MGGVQGDSLGKDQGPGGYVCWVCGRRSRISFEPEQPKRCYQCENQNCRAIVCSDCTLPKPFKGCPFCLSKVRELKS